MKGQFIIVNKHTGNILSNGQGVYLWRSGAHKGLAYWGDRICDREDFEIVELRPELLLQMLNMRPITHYKGGEYETVLDATHSETLEPMRVYQSREDGKVWVRPTGMFDETVVKNGKEVPRFELSPF